MYQSLSQRHRNIEVKPRSFGQDRKEEKPLDELEAMHQRVAESKRMEADGDQMEALESYYRSLQVSPDDSLETIEKTYERLVDFWDPGRCTDNPSFREWRGKKVTKIKQAYGKILAFRRMESGLQSAVPSIQISKEPALFASDKETTHHFTWSKIFAAFVVVVFAVFFWPTLYHYDTISPGNTSYQVRTNRVTGSITYFDQGRWNNLPMPVAKFSIPPPLHVPAPPGPPPELLAKQPIATPANEARVNRGTEGRR
jgi:hypothetical protein